MDEYGGNGDEIVEVVCGPCEKMRMSVKATLFCMTCKEPFCNNCTKLHRAQSWAQRHSYMSLTDETKASIASVLHSQVSSVRQKKSKTSRWGNSDVDKTTYMEDLKQQHDHSQIELENELFCEQHQAIVCDMCKNKEHKHCKSLVPIEDAANTKKKSCDVIELVTKLKKYNKFAEIMYQDRVQETDILEKKCKQILPQLKLVRQRFDELFKDLEKSLAAELETLHKINSRKLSQEKERLSNLKKMTNTDAEEMKEMFQDSSKTSSATFMKTFFNISNKCPVYERFLKEIYNDIENHDYTFTLDQLTLDKVDTITTIGTIKQEETYFRLPPFLVFPQATFNGKVNAKVKSLAKFGRLLTKQPKRTTESEGLGSANLSTSGSNKSSSTSSGSSKSFGGTEDSKQHPPSIQRVKNVNTFVPKTESPNTAFFITAIGCLPSGNLAIIDRSASELKVQDGSKRLPITYTFQSLPWDLAILPDLHFAVTLPGEKIIRILKMTTVTRGIKDNKNVKQKGQGKTFPKDDQINELVHVRDLNCSGECWGITYCGKKLYVTCEPWTDYPYILNVDPEESKDTGTVVPVKGVTFTDPQHIACNSTNTELYISDSGTHSIIAIDTNGQVKFVYRSHDLGCPTGISVDRQGNIYVCAKETSNVHRVPPSGNGAIVILSGSDGIVKPRGICYSNVNGNLYVANNNTSEIKAYVVS